MKKNRTIAIIDLGSNSFHMMVTRIEDNHTSMLDTLKEPVRLRRGLREDGTLSEEARKRALDCLRRFAQRTRGLDDIRVVGTNTLRRAKNTKQFLREIEDILGSQVEVIGGIEEARLIYLGVASNLPPSDQRNLVIDIGGGSTEFIIGKNMEPLVRETRPMGCVSMGMDFFHDGVMTKKRFQKSQMKVGQELETYQQTFSSDRWDRAIGSSGTIKAIRSVIEAITGSQVITREGLNAVLERIQWGKSVDQYSLPGLREDRFEVFPGGFAVLYGVFNGFGIERMDVSLNSMREGLLLDYLGRTSGLGDVRQSTVERLQTFYGVDKAQSERVKKTALALFQQIMGIIFERRNAARKLLGWAADLHEIGLAVAHSGFHKHGAYILLNGDLDGFNRVELCLLAFLVLNQRKRLKTDPLPYENEQEWPLVFIMRLACIFNRERIDVELPDLAIDWRKKQIRLQIDAKWLENRPMTKLDLEMEQAYWKRMGMSLNINKS